MAGTRYIRLTTAAVLLVDPSALSTINARLSQPCPRVFCPGPKHESRKPSPGRNLEGNATASRKYVSCSRPIDRDRSMGKFWRCSLSYQASMSLSVMIWTPLGCQVDGLGCSIIDLWPMDNNRGHAGSWPPPAGYQDGAASSFSCNFHPRPSYVPAIPVDPFVVVCGRRSE